MEVSEKYRSEINWDIMFRVERFITGVLIASAVVVLKHENPTLHQSCNFISIDLKFSAWVITLGRLPALPNEQMSSRDAT